ncbi:MAG: gliding motility-associated C-terminal domain-containing protein [Chitinophagaceae bacterium]|nr:gliding motility-associated C-terminal domain-containing protein [Chitinophagaceae bacterium]
MKKFLLSISLTLIAFSSLFAQCDLGNYAAAYPIPIASYPYTNTAGITVSAAVVNCNPLTNFTYSCGGNSFAGADPAWWINSAAASITFTFSQPVCNFTVLVNGTNQTEEFYFNCNNGAVTLQNYCTAGYTTTGAGNQLLCTNNNALGTIATAVNLAGATVYTITHNGLAAGSRLTLLDCYTATGCSTPANTITCSVPNLSYCAGETTSIPYVATGTFNAGNIFTAELSDAFGSFAAPVAIGTLASVTSGSIPVTIPIGAVTGSGYRVRVNSNSPNVQGTNNGIDFSIHALPIVTANPSPASVCQGGSLTLSGGGASTYTWSGAVINGSSFTPAATATYTVTGTDAFNCSNTSSVTVPVNPNPTVTATATPSATVCSGSPLTLNGGGATTYIWTAPAIDNVPFVPAGSAIYTVTGTDANNCSNTSTIQIVVNPLPTITINATPSSAICEGESVTLTATGASAYNWSSGVQNGIPFTPPSGTSTYTVVGTDANNCSNSQTQNIVVNPKPTVNLGNDTSFCIGNSIVLNAANPNSTYLWSNGTMNSTLNVTQTGNYFVTVNMNNCTASDTIKVDVFFLPYVYLGPDTSVCEGSEIVFDATCPGCTYLWHDNTTNPTHSIDNQGNYYVQVTSQGCSSSDTVHVVQLPLPNVDLGPDVTICKGDPLKLNAYTMGATYRWQDNTVKPYYNVTDFGTYWVEVTIGECTAKDEIVVSNSNKCFCPVFLPNAFTPNGDLLNDEFKLMNSDNIEMIKFAVYNRWGEEVFMSTSPIAAWDGHIKGQEAEMATYYYLIQYKCLYTGREYTMKGDITLLR